MSGSPVFFLRLGMPRAVHQMQPLQACTPCLVFSCRLPRMPTAPFTGFGPIDCPLPLRVDDTTACLHSNSEAHVWRRQASLLTLTAGPWLASFVFRTWRCPDDRVAYRGTRMIAPCSASLVLHLLHPRRRKNIFMSMTSHERCNEHLREQNSTRVAAYASFFPEGRLTCLGPGGEEQWRPTERPVRQRSGLAATEEWRPGRRRATWLPEEEQATQ